jgi:serine/threonine protein kinase
MATAPLALTDALHDRDTFERELGRGGMATVYLARDLKQSRKKAADLKRAKDDI